MPYDPDLLRARRSAVGFRVVDRVQALAKRSPVTCAPGTSIAEAVNLMAAEGISSVLIPHAGGTGIFTDRDLRTRVVAARHSLNAPIEQVMMPHAVTIAGSASAGQALLAMLEGGFHHLPVTDASGRIVGVVTDTDVMRTGRGSPFLLKASIERASTAAEVAEVAEGLPTVVGSLVEAGVDPVDVGRAVAHMTDALTTRSIGLELERLGSPPAPWAWLALGSQARFEQGLHSDQDHAIAFDPDAGDPVALDAYFAELAKAVVAHLEAAGIPRCSGGAMATASAFRRPVGGWVSAFRTWIADPGAEGSINSSVLFDYRQVAGPLDAEGPLDEVLRGAKGNLGFARHLAQRALDTRPPVGLFGGIRSRPLRGRVRVVDVKHRGLLIITSLARAGALLNGVTDKPTMDRLRAVAAIGGLDHAAAEGLEEAFRFLWGVRLRHQVSLALAGSAPDDLVDPRGLGPVVRKGLLEAFRQIEGAQRTMALELGLRSR